jgi:ferredoxin-type protein NapH
MKFTASARKYVAAALVTAGLAYPACAAVCPKGIGGCTSPGRCFLFTDADGNSLCDYTAGSGSSSHTVPGQALSGSQPSATEATTQAASDTASTQATTTAASHTLSLATLLAGAFLFIALCGILYTRVRKGFLGVRIERSGPALAFSSLVALGFSLSAVFILAGGALQSMTCAVVYLAAGTLLSAYLWHEGAMSRRVILVLAGVSTLAGFVFAAPVMPGEFIGLFNTLTGTSALTGAIVVLCAVIALTLVIGRTFCGHICPVGSLQELAYGVSTPKIRNRHGTAEMIRLAVFAATVLAAIYALDLMALTGLFELFSLTASVMLVIAVTLVLLSVFLYRPVCRLICPFGVLFSIAAGFSLFRMRRNSACIRCKKCEKACPAGCAGRENSKRECYLCGRCTEICPVDGALAYRR